MERKIMEAMNSLTEKDFWKSRAFLSHMRNIIEAVLVNSSNQIKLILEVVYDVKEDSTAYTDNRKIWINAGHSSIMRLNMRDKFLFIKGLLAHELTHILYSDFKELGNLMDAYGERKWYPYTPMADGFEERLEGMKEMMDGGWIFSNPPYNIRKFMHISQDLLNVLEDAYCEHMFLGNYYGALKNGLRFKVTTRRQESTEKDFLAELEEMCKSEETAEDVWNVFRMLCYRCSILDLDIEDFFKETKGYALFLECRPWIDKFLVQKHTRMRYSYINEILVICWPVLKEMIYQEQQEESSNENKNGRGQGKGGKEQSENYGNSRNSESSYNSLEQLAKLGIKCNPKMSGEPQKATQLSQEELSNEEKLVGHIQEKVTEEKEMKKEDKKEMTQLQSYADEIDPSLFIIRPEVSVENEFKYEELIAPLRIISKNMQRKILQVLKDKRNGGKLTGLYCGRKLNVRAVPRNDGRVFYNNKIPTKEPTIALSIMIDLSGSMSGHKIKSAQKTAILMEDFCRNLKIPVCIMGHFADSRLQGDTCIKIFADFKNSDRQDKYRLIDIKAQNNNRDDVAVRFMYEQLKKRMETIRIAMIISDGKPAAYGLNVLKCKERVRQLKKEADRNGIITFAAAIDSDKDDIREMYGDSFLDITDLEKLPSIFASKLIQFLR